MSLGNDPSPSGQTQKLYITIERTKKLYITIENKKTLHNYDKLFELGLYRPLFLETLK